jgi:hypothetical protein
MIETLQAISDDLGLCISEHYESFGLMQRLQRKFKETEILEWVDYFMVYDLKMIEILGEERDDCEKRLKELRRARQDSPGDGDGDQISERTGVYVAANVWNPKPGPIHGGIQGWGVDHDLGVHEERENTPGPDPDRELHQAEMFSPVVQLRGTYTAISPSISDSATPVSTAGIEGERDGLAGGPDLGSSSEIQLPVCVHRSPALSVRPGEEQEPKPGYRAGDPEVEGVDDQARDHNFPVMPHPAAEGGRRGIKLREDTRQLLCGPGERFSDHDRPNTGEGSELCGGESGVSSENWCDEGESIS